MKLLAAAIRAYRIHAELKVEFSGNPTLVAGPNESGKSTFIEAIHRGLFLKAKTGGEVLREMKSDQGGIPRIEVSFETAAGRFTVRKQFAGSTKSTTVLEQAGAATLKDELAEERLAQVLGVDAAISGGGAAAKLDKRWAHLWVLQGRSGQNPSGEMEDHQGALVTRLQAMGGAGAVQSELDSLVHQRLKMELESLLKGKDQPRAGTRLHELGQTLAELETRAAAIREVIGTLEDALAQIDEADAVIAEKTSQLVQIKDRLHDARKRQDEVQAVRLELQPILIELQSAEQRLAALQKQSQEMEEAAAALPKLEAVQAEVAEKAGRLEREAESATVILKAVDGKLVEARLKMERGQQFLDAAQAQKEMLQLRRQMDENEKLSGELAKQKQLLDEHRTRLARLPKITVQVLAKLRSLKETLVEAEADFRAIATRVEVLAAGTPLEIQGKAAVAGADQSFSGAFEIRSGQGMHLRITPGGGESLAGSIARRDEARKNFDEALAKAEVPGLAEAEKYGTERSELETEIKSLEKLLKTAGWEELRGKLEQSREQFAAAEAKIARFHTALGNWQPVPEEKAAEKKWQELDRSQAHLKIEAKGLEASRTRTGEQQEKIAAQAAQALAQWQAAKDVLRDAETKRLALEQAYGTAEERKGRLEEFRKRQEVLEEQKAGADRKLEELRAPGVESEVAMLGASLETQQRLIQQKSEQKAAAWSILQHAGTTDPFGDLNEILEQKRQVESQHQTERDRVRALQRLVELFDAQMATLEHRFTLPLLERVSGYLGIVFGTGTKAEARYQEGFFTGLSLNRSAQGLGTHGFERLSGGAREQLGVAFRLAVAEILSEEHDDCLPLVLDDAFVNSDPERVRALQLMIHRATSRGVQVILTTCTPSDYAGLGAHEIRLSRPSGRANQTISFPEENEAD